MTVSPFTHWLLQSLAGVCRKKRIFKGYIEHLWEPIVRGMDNAVVTLLVCKGPEIHGDTAFE